MIGLDLANLNSVDRACNDVISAVGPGRIDALALNAGTQHVRDNQTSVDGFELTFAVNFLLHFLIAERLKGYMRAGGRIVMTSGEVHDPKPYCLMGISKSNVAGPCHSFRPTTRTRRRRVNSQPRRGEEARYSASKLLNLMHARYLAKELSDVAVIAFNPSVVPGTDIARDRNWLQKVGWKYIMPVMAPILQGARSLARASSDLFRLLTAPDAGRLSGNDIDGREIQPGSDESRDWRKITRTIQVENYLVNERLRRTGLSLPSRFSAI